MMVNVRTVAQRPPRSSTRVRVFSSRAAPLLPVDGASGRRGCHAYAAGPGVSVPSRSDIVDALKVRQSPVNLTGSCARRAPPRRGRRRATTGDPWNGRHLRSTRMSCWWSGSASQIELPPTAIPAFESVGGKTGTVAITRSAEEVTTKSGPLFTQIFLAAAVTPINAPGRASREATRFVCGSIPTMPPPPSRPDRTVTNTHRLFTTTSAREG